ncbi:hypothetical protein [Agarilytica rhodophyticola]|uniref:hypothetical protein n=1 Tax=Agarilytica rhodophyticola TaxID=1737490 RepID=UPI000B3483FF|nr:hypothetical protein [Agarilytica rhodophyticola]
MSVELFLKDNGFSDKASTSPNTYIKDLKTSCKNLHAHIKVTLNTNGNTFEIHATVRLAGDAKDIARGKNDDSALGRAIWVYAKNQYHTPQNIDWWIKNGEIYRAPLKKLCKSLSKEVEKFIYEIERLGPKYKQSLRAKSDTNSI